MNKVAQKVVDIQRLTKLSNYEFGFMLSFIFNLLISRIIHFTAPEEQVYNYYNNKKNIFNQLFVKKGWGWTTLLIIFYYASKMINEKPKQGNKDSNIKLMGGAVIRYVMISIWWIFFTQWCFGLPIMDKIFVLTGGKCVIEKEPLQHHKYPHIHQTFIKSIEDEIWTSTGITSYHCKRIKGNWDGGHDPSGHVFLLVQSSLYLFMETFNSWKNTSRLSEILTTDVKMIVGIIWEVPQTLIIGLIGLWWFMLLMTNVYFHSILEKVVGLLFGYLAVIAVYVIPRIYKKDKTS